MIYQIFGEKIFGKKIFGKKFLGKKFVSVLLSASVERFDVSRMRDFFTCVWKIQVFRSKNLIQNPFFSPDFVLALMVSEKVLERQFQGLFESGPKN